MPDAKREVEWIASAKKDLRGFPPQVRRDVGLALYQVELGGTPKIAKPLKGFSGVSVMEIVEDFQTDTYRAIYTAKFGNMIYVLHGFQKKSKRGIETAQADMDTIRQRFKAAELDFKNRGGKHEAKQKSGDGRQ